MDSYVNSCVLANILARFGSLTSICLCLDVRRNTIKQRMRRLLSSPLRSPALGSRNQAGSWKAGKVTKVPLYGMPPHLYWVIVAAKGGRNRNPRRYAPTHRPKFRCGETSASFADLWSCTGIEPAGLFPNRTPPTISVALGIEIPLAHH